MGESFVTNVDCGGIKSGSEISSDDTLQDTVKNMLYKPEPPAPSTEYESISIGTWSSANDVDNFFTAHTAWNGWAGLKLGNYVTINDGTYNTQWEIAGFNCEHNQTAADNTVYDNGYGIVMIPKTTLGNMSWNDSATLVGAYISSTIHTSHLVTVANNLKNVLGNHLISRNVLLSDAVSGSNMNSSSYTWTTSYATLMSIGQCNGTFSRNRNKYDDGEANYKLPLFDHEDFKTGSNFWSRCIFGYVSSIYFVWSVINDGSIGYNGLGAYDTRGVRPLIYLR